MNKLDPPKTFGVFKPVGHTVIAYRSATELQAASSALIAQGFAGPALSCYTPEEMVAQVDAELRTASPLASFGYKLDLIQAHRALAQSGCSFLVVHAPDEAQAECVAAVARSTHAVAAQHYGIFMIEELADLSPGDAADA